MKSDGAISPLTEDVSPYAPPSISKIKQESISKAKYDKLETIKNLTKDAFANNPAFLDTNPNSSRNKQIYIDTLAKKGYDVSELQQLNPVSQENKEAINDILNPGFLDGMANDAAEGVKQGGGQVLKGVEKMYDPRSSLKDIVTGGTNAVAGAIKTGFALAGAVVPELLLFNAATKTVKGLPNSVKSTLMEFGNSASGLTEEQKVENFDKTIDFPFAAASIIAEGMGYKPEDESFGKAILEITDIVLPLALGKAGAEIKGRVKDINDIKEISKKITENKATEQEVKDYVAISKASENVSIEEVKDHSDLKGLEKEHNVSPEESKLHSDLEESFSDQKKISDAGLPPSDVVELKISNLQNEIKDINEKEGLFGINDAFNEVEKVSREEQVKSLEETKNVEGLSESAKAEIDKQIEAIKPKEPTKELRSDSELENKMSELENSGLKFQSKEAAEFNVIEKEMEKRERESVFNTPLEEASEAIDALIKKEKDKPNGYGSFIERRDTSESKEVISKYLKADELSDSEVMKDFVDALRGKPATWYADGIQLRESVKEASKRGIGTDKLIDKAKDVYLKDGYSEKDASEVVGMFLEPLLKDVKEVKSETPIENIVPETELSEETTKIEGSKKLKLGERILASEEVSVDIKTGLQEKGIDYVPVNLEVTQADAKAYVKSFNEIGEIEKAISNTTDTSNPMTRINRAAIGKELFEVLAEKSDKAETVEDQKFYQDKAVDIAKFTAENFKSAGQEINAAKAWKRMLEKTPEGAITSIKKSQAEANAPILDLHKSDIADAKSIIDEFIKSKDFETIVGEKVKAEFDKLAKKSPKKENIFNSKSVRDTRKVELMKKWDSAKGVASSSLVGFNKEQIEVLGEMGVIHVIDGAYNFKQWANKMRKDFNDLTAEQLEDIWNKVKVPKEYDESQRTLSDFSKTGVFDKMSVETKNDFLDKLNKKLGKLNKESRRKLLGEAISEIEKLGGLSDERFRDMYAKELGLPTLDAVAEGKIRELVKTINKSEKSARELQDLFDKGADKKEIAAKQKEWIDDVFNGQKANAELSEFFKKDKTLGITLSTILQGNLLGTMSLVKNIYSNSLIQPLRFASRGLSSIADYSMSKAASLPLMNKLINEGRTIDALAYWKGETKGALPGLKTSMKELIKGINPEEMIERDLSQQLQPLKSMVKFYEGLKGEKKQTAYQQINNFTEATFGMPAEIMFRLLNLGDKPFRKAAEFGAAYEIGRMKGLKGKELDKFVLFPDAKSAETIKLRSEQAVYQQSEGLTKVAQESLSKFESYLSELPYIGDISKIIFKSQIPYVKTPLNILGETFQFAFPEYSAAKGIYHSVKGNRRLALEHLGKAVTGFAIRSAVTSLIQNNLVTGSTDYKDAEGTAIQLQNVPPNSINITGLQRMSSGGDPSIKDDDVWINYNNMGVTGLLIGINANQKDLKKEEKGYLGELATNSAYIAKASLEQSFLQGTSAFLEAVQGNDKQKRKWAISTLGALGSIVYPNTLANISKASNENIKSTKAELFTDELANTFKTKMFAGGELPTKVNLWGESIKSAPEGRSKYAWYLLDVTKAKTVDTDSYNYKIYDLWNKASDDKAKKDILPNIPTNSLTIKKEQVKLSPKMYEEYQMIVGKNRANLVEKYAGSPNWDKDSEEEKVKKLKSIYSVGLESGKSKMIFNHPELKTTP